MGHTANDLRNLELRTDLRMLQVDHLVRSQYRIHHHHCLDNHHRHPTLHFHLDIGVVVVVVDNIAVVVVADAFVCLTIACATMH